MESKRISFSNEVLDKFGMPTDYRSYMIIGRAADMGEANVGDGIAKVYPASQRAIPLNPDVFVAAGGARIAIDAAITALRQLNGGLNERIADVPVL